MYDIVMCDKDMLRKIESILDETRIFLVGITPNDCVGEQQEDNCLQDSMRKNSQAIDRILGLSISINEILKGQKK